MLTVQRKPNYEPGGREFESLRARHFSDTYDILNRAGFRLCQFFASNELESRHVVGKFSQMAGTEMRVLHHHLERLPAAKLLKHG